MPSNVISFKGVFDGSDILNKLKQIRQSMDDAGADANLFKNVDKDIAKTEQLVNSMLAQIKKGFSGNQEISGFTKNIDKLQMDLLKISQGLSNVNLGENFHFDTGEIARLTSELSRLEGMQDSLNEKAKQSIRSKLESIKTTKAEREQILSEVKAQGDLEAAIVKVGQAKERAAKIKNQSAAAESDKGQEFFADAVAGFNSEDLKVRAHNETKARGHDDVRIKKGNRYVTDDSGNRTFDVAAANAAIDTSFQKALQDTIKNGGNAEDAVKAMCEEIHRYGIELTEINGLQERFNSEMTRFSEEVMTSQQRKAIQNAQTLGSTDTATGEYTISEKGQDLINDSELANFQQVLTQMHTVAALLEQVITNAQGKAESYANDTNSALDNVNENINRSSESWKQSAEDISQANQKAKDIDETFNNIKGRVKDILSIGSAFNGIKNVIQETFNTIQELDKSFAEIAMVTDYSVKDMWDSYGDYAQMANKLGQTTQSVIQASGLFYQQGLDTAESLTLTEDTMKLATLAGLDFKEATSQMTAALRGFKMEMDEGERVTDVYSELAAKAAADVSGIANAMTKTASIASSAGMEFETTSAFLTQMINVK